MILKPKAALNKAMTKIRINNILLPISEYLSSEYIENYTKLPRGSIKNFKIVKQSVDARRKNNIHFVFSLIADTDLSPKMQLAENISVFSLPQKPNILPIKKYKNPLIVVGYGPAGIFCGYTLAKYGYNPIIIERGKNVDERTADVEHFLNCGVLNPESNVQFGEGGAGTFSDGKLTTRIGDYRCADVLEILHKFGAPEDILYSAKPHIGTDILKKVVKNIRLETEKLGGKILFNTRLEGINFDSNVKSVFTNKGELPCDVLVLAIGHSSRDTFSMLKKYDIYYENKSFAVGVRIEHPKEFIDRSQYGEAAGHPSLAPAEYYLKYNGENRSCYSFCMCPGGEIIPSASEEKTVVTNGMSNRARNGAYANSGIVVTVSDKDFGVGGGIEFQRLLEQQAFKLGGGDYKAPYQLCGDFLEKKKTMNQLNTTYAFGVTGADFSELFPAFITQTLADGLRFFNRKIPGFAGKNVPLIGVESRTSSPIRIVRGEDFQAKDILGLYPCGEGAGYAGGIMSAAVDGIKVAEKIMGN